VWLRLGCGKNDDDLIDVCGNDPLALPRTRRAPRQL